MDVEWGGDDDRAKLGQMTVDELGCSGGADEPCEVT